MGKYLTSLSPKSIWIRWAQTNKIDTLAFWSRRLRWISYLNTLIQLKVKNKLYSLTLYGGGGGSTAPSAIEQKWKILTKLQIMMLNAPQISPWKSVYILICGAKRPTSTKHLYICGNVLYPESNHEQPKTPTLNSPNPFQLFTNCPSYHIRHTPNFMKSMQVFPPCY